MFAGDIILDMKLFVVRHGQTDWNLEHRSQGRTDIPLNATGFLQAEETRDRLAGVKFDICYASPLKRAAKTAEIIVGDKCPIAYNDLLVERCFGEFEGSAGETWEVITGGINIFDLELNFSESGVEPMSAVLERARKFLELVKAENPDTARVLVVAHGVILKALHFVIVGYDEDTDFLSYQLKNGQVGEYEI